MPTFERSTSRLKILIFTGVYEPGFRGGGPIRSVAQIVATAPAGADIWIITSDRDLGATDPYPGLSGRWATRGRARVFYLDESNPAMWLRLMRDSKAIHFDIVYLNSLWSPRFSIVPALAIRCGVIRTRTTLVAPRGELAMNARAIKASKKAAALRIISPLLQRLGAVLHASTPMEALDIQRALPWAKVEVSVDQVDLPLEPLKPRPGMGARIQLCFISRISRIKNLDIALSALDTQSSPIDFQIFGPIEDSKYWAECLQLIERLPDNVTATYGGELAPNSVARKFNEFDAFIFPTGGENFGHVIAESLSASCPVFCSAHTSWTDALREGGGIVVETDSRDAWASAITHFSRLPSQDRQMLREKAGETYRKWRATNGATNILSTVANLRQDTPAGHLVREPRKIRVALVTHGYLNGGGVTSVANWLRNGLRATGRYDVDVHVLATARNDRQSRRLARPGSWLRTLKPTYAADSGAWFWGANITELEFMRYAKRAKLSQAMRQYDLIQVVCGGPAFAVPVSDLGIPVCLQVATLTAWERSSSEEHSGPRAIWAKAMTKLASQLETSALLSADMVLVENDVLLQYIEQLGQRRVVKAPPGVDTDIFFPATHWDPNGYFLSVARFGDERKGLMRMMRGYAAIVARRRDCPPLVLAGRGRPPAQLLATIAGLGLTSRVEFRVDVPEGDLPGLYRGASVFLQTSFEEGLGLSVVEAMACGVPVVATETAGTLETIANGVTGWLVEQNRMSKHDPDFADHVLSIITGDEGDRFSANARRRAVEQFSSAATLTKFERAYDEVLGIGRLLDENRPSRNGWAARPERTFDSIRSERMDS